MGTRWLASFLLAFCVGLPSIEGNPCVDGTHSCEVSSQRCVPDNSTDNFTCQCLRADQQLDHFFTCTDLPDSQVLYVTTPINTTDADILLVFQIIGSASNSEQILRDIYSSLTALPTYKDVKFLEYLVTPVPSFRIAVYALLFSENVTSDIREAVARAALHIEEVGFIRTPNNVTVTIEGKMGIFDTLENARNDEKEDDMDWCSFPSLYSCRKKSTCRDVGLRYDCPCDPGFEDDGTNCYGAAITAPSPFDTDGTRDLHLVCDVESATEVTQYEWSDACLQKEGSRCTIRPQPLKDDGKTVTCTARSANGESFTASSVLELNYPPPSAPLLEGYRGGDRLPVGDNLMMTCSVIGGKPLASGVLFSCPRHRPVSPDVTGADGVSSVLTFQLTSEDDGAVCTCSALWKRRSWYTSYTTTVLRVGAEGGDAHSGEDSDFKWYIIFAGLGFFLILLITLAVIVCRQRAPSKYDSTTPPGTENNSAGTTKIHTSGKGSRQPRHELSSLESGVTTQNMDRIPRYAPNRHEWRPPNGPSPRGWESVEDFSAWSLRRLDEADYRRHRRRNSAGGESGVYDQISGGVADFFPMGDSSGSYLNPSAVTGHYSRHLHPFP